jgi:hypothetical protein
MSDTTKYLLSAAVMLAVVAYPLARVVGFTSDIARML